MKKTRPDLYFHIDGHLNASGHAFIAHMLLDHDSFTFPAVGDALP
jgi:hypothetical protein